MREEADKNRGCSVHFVAVGLREPEGLGRVPPDADLKDSRPGLERWRVGAGLMVRRSTRQSSPSSTKWRGDLRKLPTPDSRVLLQLTGTPIAAVPPVSCESLVAANSDLLVEQEGKWKSEGEEELKLEKQGPSASRSAGGGGEPAGS